MTNIVVHGYRSIELGPKGNPQVKLGDGDIFAEVVFIIVEDRIYFFVYLGLTVWTNNCLSTIK